MGFLCAAGLRSEATPPVSIVGPEYPDEAWPVFRGMITDDRGHWQPVFERRSSAEKRALAPMLCGLAIAQAFRRQDFSAMHGARVAAKAVRLAHAPVPRRGHGYAACPRRRYARVCDTATVVNRILLRSRLSRIVVCPARDYVEAALGVRGCAWWRGCSL